MSKRVDMLDLRLSDGPAYRMKISGTVNGIEIEGVMRDWYSNIEPPTQRLVNDSITLWRVGDSKPVPPGVKTKVERAVLKKLEAVAAYTPNKGRPKVYDAYEDAKRMRETFTDRPVERTFKVGFDWPASLQQIGDSLAVAYASDKWQPKTASGKRDHELYKHLAESRNVAFAKPGILVDRDNMQKAWPVIGPRVSFSELPMPKHFAELGWFEEICLKLYTGGTAKKPKFGSGDDGIVHVQIQHAFLAGSKVQWSRVDSRRQNQPFLFVYTKKEGVMFLVFGEELDVEKDGIVG